MAVQLPLWSIDQQAPMWALEGMVCPKCVAGSRVGRFQLVVASEGCGCNMPSCVCLAEGYAKCTTCGDLRQVWPREMVVQYQVASRTA